MLVDHLFKRSCKSLNQWFSTGVPRNPRVPLKALGVPPINELFTGKLKLGVPPKCSIIEEGCRESKRLRNTGLSHSRIKFNQQFFLVLLQFFIDSFAKDMKLIGAIIQSGKTIHLIRKKQIVGTKNTTFLWVKHYHGLCGMQVNEF